MKYRVIEEYPAADGYMCGYPRQKWYVEYAKQDFMGKDTWHVITEVDNEGEEQPKIFKHMWDAVKYIDSKVPTKRRRKVVYESVP